MKKALKWTLGTFAVIFILGSAALFFIFSPQLKSYIEVEGSKALSAQVRVRTLRFTSFLPLIIRANDLQIEKPSSYTVIVESIRGRVWWRGIPFLGGAFTLSLETENANIDYFLGAKEEVPPSASSESEASTSAAATPNLDVSILFKKTKITLKPSDADGAFKAASVQIPNFQFEKRNIGDGEIPATLKFSGNADVATGGRTVVIPFSMSTKKLYLTPEFASSEDLKFEVSGFEALAKGKTNFKPALVHDWVAQVQMEDFSKAGIPPDFLPKGKWTGGLQGQAKFSQSAGQKPAVDFSLQTHKLAGLLDWTMNKDLSLKGPLEIELQVNGRFHEGLDINQLQLSLLANDLEVKFKDLLNKPAGVPLNIQISAVTENKLIQIKNAQLRFSQLRAKAEGELQSESGQQSKLSFVIFPTDLSGFEKLSPMLSAYPLKGEIELNSSFSGDLFAPEQANLTIQPLRLEKVSGQIGWQNQEGIKLQGPFVLDGTVQLTAQGQTLKSAAINLFADLSGMNIEFKDNLKKFAGQKTQIRLQGTQRVDAIQFTNSQIQYLNSQIVVSGKVTQPQRPKLALTLQMKPLDLGQLSQAIPKMKDFNLSGNVSGALSIQGFYDFAGGIQKSPLVLVGQLQANIPKYLKMESKKEIGKGGKDSLPGVPAEPLIPDWPIFRNAKVSFGLSLGELLANGLEVRGVVAKGQFTGGKVKASGSIIEVFKGTAEFQNVETDLYLVPMNISGGAKVTDLALKPAVAWAMPEYVDSVSGNLTGQSQFRMTYPLPEKIMTGVNFQGKLSSDNLSLKSVDIVKIVKEKLKDYPALEKYLEVKPTQAFLNVRSDFKFVSGVMDLTSLIVKSIDGNEVKGHGKMNLTGGNEFKGDFWIANPKVKSNCKNILDAQGRLVLLGVEVKDKEWTNWNDHLTKIGEKIISCQIKTEGDKLKQNLQDNLKKGIGDQLKKFLGP